MNPDTATAPAAAGSTSQLTIVPAPRRAEAPSISATEMSRLSGVDRERMRTWERRHGFPVPVRAPNGQRRYLADDVRRVCAISRLSASGVSLTDAIRTVLEQPEATGIASLGPALDGISTPALAVGGPHPLRVEWTNVATRAATGAPAIGDDLDGGERTLGPVACAQIRALMVSADAASTAVVQVTDWMQQIPTPCTALAWRVDAAEPGAAPVVVIVQLPSHVPTLENGADEATAWAEAVRTARGALDRGHGLQSVQEAMLELVVAVGATDAVIALRSGRTIRSARSVRGTVVARQLSASAASCVAPNRSRGPEWMSERGLVAFGVDPRQRALAVPLYVGSEPIGLALLIFRTEVPMSTVAGELLLGFGSALAAVVERGRAVARARPPVAA